MADPIVVAPPPKNALVDRIFSLHTLLALLSATALILSGTPRFAAWADILRQITILLGGGAVTSATAYQSPRQRAILEMHSPTPCKPPAPPAAPPSLPPAAAVVALLLLLPFVSACLPPIAACKLPTPANVAQCKLENDLIACGEQWGLNLLPVVLDLIATAVGGTFDPAAIAAELEALGFKDAPCLLAAIETYLLPTAPAVAARVHNVLVYQLAKAGKHGLVSIKLHGGAIVQAVVP